MDTTVKLDERHYDAVLERAREQGITPEVYVQALIDQAGRGFDEMLRPVRNGFSALSDEELDAMFDRALHAARASS